MAENVDNKTAISIRYILKNVIQSFNTLLDCPMQFSGESNPEKVLQFIAYVSRYKRIKCIPDAQALEELRYLLTDQANIWWIHRQTTVTSWAEALTKLEYQYCYPTQNEDYYPSSKKHMPFAGPSEAMRQTREIFQDNYHFHPREMNAQTLHQERYEERENNVEIATVSLNPNSKVPDKFKGIGMSELVLEQLIAIIKNQNRKTDKKQKFLLELPDLGSFRVILRRSGNHTIRAVPPRNTSENDNHSASDNLTKETTNENFSNLQQSQIENSNVEVNGGEETKNIANTKEKEPIIKVRRTKDLMPEIKNQEEQDEFISDIPTTNTTSHDNQENFQIDSDIICQINNIIDESEIKMEMDNNRHFATSSSEQQESLYNTETTEQLETPTSSSSDTQKPHLAIKQKFVYGLQSAKKIKLDVPQPSSSSNSIIPSPNNCPPSLTATDISSLLSNIPEKCINTLLNTKTTDSHIGKTSNQTKTAKARTH